MIDDEFERELIEALPCMDRTARLYLRSGDDRRDVVQEAALRAWASRSQFRGDHFNAWTHAIIRNVVFDIHRRKHAPSRPPETSMPERFDAVDERSTCTHEDDALVMKLVRTLPKPMRVAVEVYLNDLDRGHNSTIKVRYHRAILMMRAKLCARQGRRTALSNSST